MRFFLTQRRTKDESERYECRAKVLDGILHPIIDRTTQANDRCPSVRSGSTRIQHRILCIQRCKVKKYKCFRSRFLSDRQRSMGVSHQGFKEDGRLYQRANQRVSGETIGKGSHRKGRSIIFSCATVSPSGIVANAKLHLVSDSFSRPPEARRV